MSTTDFPEKKTYTAFKIATILSAIAVILAVGSIGFDVTDFVTAHHDHDQVQRLVKTTALATLEQAQTMDEFKKSMTQTSVQSAYIISAVKYLVYLANIELSIRHNTVAALHTLTEAQQALGDSHPNIHLALTHDINALQSAPEVHIHQIFSDLSSVSNQIEKISMIPSETPITMKKTMEEIKSSVNDDHKNWRGKLWASISQVKNLFVIRHLDQPNTPLLDTQLALAAKQNMITQINIAEWALLHNDQIVYQTALKTISQWLAQYFSLSSSTTALISKIDALSKINIAPTLPSLKATLDAVANINVPVKKNNIPKKIISAPATGEI